MALEKLLQQPRDPNAENEEGFTPLHFAAYCGHVELVRLLVEAGADIEYTRSLAQNPPCILQLKRASSPWFDFWWT